MGFIVSVCTDIDVVGLLVLGFEVDVLSEDFEQRSYYKELREGVRLRCVFHAQDGYLYSELVVYGEGVDARVLGIDDILHISRIFGG